MPKTLDEGVREICLWFPETAEVPSRGSPDFRVKNKTFATYVVNHHGDGRIALNVLLPPGGQQLHVETEPEHYFVPAYTGPRGWLGIHLDHGLPWDSIGRRVLEAYRHVAPKSLAAEVDAVPELEPPTDTVPAEEFDPLSVPHARSILDRLRARALALPEVVEDTAFGNPVFRAGKKTFVTAQRYARRMTLQFWVGGEGQAMLTGDPRYHVPAYTGHNGWIALDVEDGADVDVRLLDSYRHFALKRMLKAPDAGLA